MEAIGGLELRIALHTVEVGKRIALKIFGVVLSIATPGTGWQPSIGDNRNAAHGYKISQQGVPDIRNFVFQPLDGAIEAIEIARVAFNGGRFQHQFIVGGAGNAKRGGGVYSP